MIEVSIIVPTFNSEKYALNLCKSIKEQTFTNFEVIIIDNNSLDETLLKLKKISYSDKRFKYYNISNEGSIAKSRNYGITKSIGRYIAFHDSDDFWFKNKLEVSIREIRKSDFTYHSLRTHNKNNIFDQRKLSSYSLLENKSFKQLMTIGNPINTSSVLCKREIFEVVKFCEGKKFITVEDFECWINISRNNFRFKRIDKVLGYYNISSQNTSVTYVKNPLKFIHIFNKHKKYLLNDNLKVLSKNHFRYLMAYSLKKRELKKKYFYYLLFSKILKSKLKIILRLFFTLF